MKVLKFGGTSVGAPETLNTLREIALAQEQPAIIVVSALSGVTDQLIRAAQLASEGDPAFRDLLQQIRRRHLEIPAQIISDPAVLDRLNAGTEDLLSRLEHICEGLCMLQVLPEKTRLEIESFGERLSARIVAASIPGGTVYDSLHFIKTVRHGLIHSVDQVRTEALIREAFRDYGPGDGIAVVPGFISSDAQTGQISNLGRGGSDYTASLIAAALDAEILEIWTDVDGFMTADPKKIKTSYVIDEMTYEEATELCNFGAKVIYSPAMYPVHAKNIPILIKNTFNPSASGTVIHGSCQKGTTAIIGSL